MQKIRLLSDFHDYYDHWFDIYGTTLSFERMSTNGMSRRRMLEYMQSLGIRVPLFGLPHELLYGQNKSINTLAVIHVDEFAHRGEGKVKTTLGEAISAYPGHLAVEYVPNDTSKGSQSFRYLQVGDNRFWLEYSGRSDWRSNYGDVDIRVLSYTASEYHKTITAPLFAVDFIADSLGTLHAVDFNTSPGIRGTGVEDILPAKDAADAIKTALCRIHKRGTFETPESIDVRLGGEIFAKL